MIRRNRSTMPHPEMQNPEVIDAIIRTFQERWPNNCASIEPYIAHLTGADETALDDVFSLLMGEVQSGKFLTINILTWILVFKHQYRVSYLTKRLDIVRTDVLGKLHNGLIKQVVDQCCSDHNVDASMYQLDTIGGLALTAAKSRERKVCPIFLMENVNYLRLLEHLQRNTREKMLVIADEVHELFTDTSFDILDGGLRQGSTITNRHFLHKLYSMCKETSGLRILGVTATPERTLVKDPLCCVDRVFYLTPDPPVKGFNYYGYNREGLQNVAVCERDDSDVDTINQILSRKTTVLNNGQHEIKVVYICTATYAADQAVIYERIVREFGDRVYCKMLISDDTRRDNDIPTEYVVSSLAAFFNGSNLTDEICTNGALVLIARKTLAASATVKPEIGSSCTRFVDGHQHTVVGITDQITGAGSSIEDHMQKSRLFGWYPAGHSSTYWVAAEYMADMQHGVNDTHRRIVDQYDCKHRLESIGTLVSSMSKVPRICAGECPYRRGGFGYVVVSSCGRPSYGEEVTTDELADDETIQARIEDGPVWVEADGSYLIYLQTRILNHAQIERFESWKPAPFHAQVLRNMVQHGKDKQKVTRFYDVFGKIIKETLKDIQGDTYYSSWQANLYKELDETTIAAGKKIAEDDTLHTMGLKVRAGKKLLASWIRRKLAEDEDESEAESVESEPADDQVVIMRPRVRAKARKTKGARVRAVARPKTVARTCTKPRAIPRIRRIEQVVAA